MERNDAAPEPTGVTFDHVLFDLDGTLTDPAEGIFKSILEALSVLGITAPDEATLRRCIGPPLQRSFPLWLNVPAERVDEAMALYRKRYGEQGMLENVPYPHTREVLEALRRRGHTLWVVTVKPVLFARPILEHFGLAGFFSGIFGAELDGTRADKRELLAHVVTTHGIAVDRAVMIGDHDHDIAAAKHVGMRSVGVTWGYGSREELEHAGATWIVDTGEALLRALG